MIIFDFDLTLVDTTPIEPLRAQRRWREVMSRLDGLEVYDGIGKLLEDLHRRGQVLAIVTRSPDMLPREFIRKRRWPIDIVLGFHQVKRRKPHPDALLMAMRMGNASASDTCHVGDEADDTKASYAAHVQALGAAWGAKDVEALERSNPHHLFRTVQDLRAFLLSTP